MVLRNTCLVNGGRKKGKTEVRGKKSYWGYFSLRFLVFKKRTIMHFPHKTVLRMTCDNTNKMLRIVPGT